jgi:hypothetical protein
MMNSLFIVFGERGDLPINYWQNKHLAYRTQWLGKRDANPIVAFCLKAQR